MSSLSRTLRLAVALALALTALPLPAQAPASPPQVRRVFVTDSRCKEKGAEKADHRECALRCISNGARMLIFDTRREALYEIEAPGKVRFELQNEYAGLEALVQGRWNDEELRVVVEAVYPPGSADIPESSID